MVDKRQVNFIKFLESKKIKVVPVSMRHIYTQGGGIHCATLDTVGKVNLKVILIKTKNIFFSNIQL